MSPRPFFLQKTCSPRHKYPVLRFIGRTDCRIARKARQKRGPQQYHGLLSKKLSGDDAGLLMFCSEEGGEERIDMVRVSLIALLVVLVVGIRPASTYTNPANGHWYRMTSARLLY